MLTKDRLGQLSPQDRQALLDRLVAGKGETGLAHKVEKLPLSNAQQRIWLFEQFNASSAAYNIVSAIRFFGSLDLSALRWAFQQVVNRHEVLRTRFVENDQTVEQVIVDQLDVHIEEVDGRRLGTKVDGEALQQRLAELSAVDFRLSTLPLFKLSVLRLADDSAVLVFVLHHILADGWSLQLLEQEVSRYYLDYQRGKRRLQGPGEYQFRDHVQWQLSWFTSERYRKQLDYWQAALGDAPSRLQLPIRSPRREVTSLASSSLIFELPGDTLTALRQYSQERDVSLFMLLMGAFKVAVSHFAGVEDVIVGTPVANRSRKQFEQVIGLFSNTLAIRTRPELGKSFADYIQEVRQQMLGAYANQELPFDEVVDAVAPARSAAHSPLFQVLFALQASEASKLSLGGVTIEPIHLKRTLIEFDLVAELFLTEQSNTAVLSYRTELYTERFIQSLWESFQRLLDGLLKAPEQSIETHRSTLAHAHIVDAGEDRETELRLVDASSSRTAIIVGDQSLPVSELHEDVAAVTCGISQVTVAAEQPLLIMAESQLELFVAMLALQACGFEHGFVRTQNLPAELSRLAKAGVRIMVCCDEAQQPVTGYQVCSVKSLRRPAAPLIGPLEPATSLWMVENGCALQLTVAQLLHSVTFVQTYLRADGPILIAECLAMDLQLSVKYAALANGQTVHIVGPTDAAMAALSHTLGTAHMVIIPGDWNGAESWGNDLAQLVYVGADVAELPRRSGSAACFSSAAFGGVFMWHERQSNVRLRSDIKTAWVMNSLGEVLPQGVRGDLFLPTESGGRAATGLTAVLNDQLSELALSTRDWVWRRGQLLNLSVLTRTIGDLQDVSEAVVRVRDDLTGRRQLLCYVQPRKLTTESQLRGMSESVLEPQAVPDAFVIVSHIPRDRNGAVDSVQLDNTPVLHGLIGESPVAAEHDKQRIIWDMPRQDQLTVGNGSSSRELMVSERLPGDIGSVTSESEAIVYGPRLESACPFSCLAEVLEHAASQYSDQEVVFITDGDGHAVRFRYETLLDHALRVAGGLVASGLRPQDILMLQLADNPSLTIAYWGCVLAGVVPIVAATPESYAAENKDAEKIIKVCESIEIAGVIGGDGSYAELGESSEVQGLGCRLLDLRELIESTPLPRAHRASGDDTAQMLLTSGSTGLPKAVMQSHHALLSRTQGEVQAFSFTSNDVSFNWMPMDHVGGLVMHHLTYVYLGAKQVHCPTSLVLSEPLHWLQWMSVFKATTTWAPNFAYSLVNERLKEQAVGLEDSEIDLSALQFFYNGGEAVVASVAEQFSINLMALGMRSDAMKPVWGMSETCSGVIVNTEYDPRHGGAGDVVNVGRPLPGVNVRIVDTGDRVIQEGKSGRLQLSGPIITQGYRNNAAATKDAFTPDGWFCTGDLARIDGGRITITGREKDLLIINGKNYHCQEVEQVIDKLPAVLSAHVAACGIRMAADATEKLVIFYSEQVDDADAEQTLSQINKALLSQLGLPVSYAVCLRPEQFPRTSIGKIQRNELMRAFEAGQFVDRFQDLGAAQVLPAWFYQETWLPRQPRGASCDADVALIVGSDRAVNDSLQGVLANAFGAVFQAGTGDDFGSVDEWALECGAADSDDWRALLSAALRAGGALRVVYAEPLCWRDSFLQLPALVENPEDMFLRPLVQLSKALQSLADAITQRLELVVLTRGAYRVASDSRNEPLQGMLNGFVKSLALESPGIGVRHIDLPLRWQDAQLQLGKELGQQLTEPVVALRNGRRFVPTLSAVDQSVLPKQLREFDSSGFHLVIGGLGGVGSQIVESLLRDGAAHVLVLGRSAAQRRSSAMSRFSGFGDRFAYEQIDICDADGLAALIGAYEGRWDRPLKYLFNAAGEHHPGRIGDLEDDNLLAVMRSKLVGPIAIQAALEKSKPEDFADVEQIHIGSVQAHFGGAGLSLYAAANSFLNAWCEHQHGKGLQVSCYQFSMWDNLGLTEGFLYQKQTLAQGFNILSPRQGVLSLRLLANADRSPSWLIGLDTSKMPMRLQVTGRYRGLRALQSSSVGERRDAFATVVPVYRDRAGGHEDEMARHTPTPLEREIGDIWRLLLKLDVELTPSADFFELGGNSLHIVRLINQLRERFEVDLKMQSVFDNSSLREVAALIQVQQEEKYTPIARQPRSGVEPASYSQHRVWFIDQMQGDSREYNILAGVRLKGVLGRQLLGEALSLLMERHSVLRTRYCELDGQCMQDIQDDVDLPLLQEDISGLDGEAQERQVQSMMQAAMSQRFDLQQGPLLRASLLRLGEHEHVLLFSTHHIALDGWSMSILSRDFMTLYQALCEGTTPALSVLPIEYADYAQWQRQYQASDAYRSDTAYWLRQLSDLPPLHNLPLDYPRRRRRSVAGSSVLTRLNTTVTTQIKQLAKAHKSTVFMVLHGVFALLLSRWSDETDVVVGTPVAGRGHPDLEHLVGFFINTLVLRSRINDEQCLADYLSENRQLVLDAFAHQAVPFDALIDRLSVQPSVSHMPLVQIMFALQNFEAVDLQLPRLEVSSIDTPLSSVRFDLELIATEQAGELALSWNYATDLFAPANIEAMAAGFERLLQGIVANPEARLAELCEAHVTTGQLHVQQRKNRQRQFRGYRVNLHALRQQLLELDGVSDAWVDIKCVGQAQHLVVYLLTDPDPDCPQSEAEIQYALRDVLPDYLLPSGLCCLHEFPVDSEGKVDVDALPEIAIQSVAGYVAPATELEQQLADIWCDLLQLEPDGVSVLASFFELGGNSLSVSRLVLEIEDSLRQEISVRTLYENPTIRALAGRLEKHAEQRTDTNIEKGLAGAVAPLSYAQQQLWLLHKADVSGKQYNVPYVLKLRGELDEAALRRALLELIQRHEPLRTTYAEDDGVPYQMVREVTDLALDELDLREFGWNSSSSDVRNIITEEVQRTFDLSADIMLRPMLISLTPTEHLLVVTLHHIAADGWSVTILGRELSVLYAAFKRGDNNPLPALPINYADYATWQRERRSSREDESELAFWKEELKDAPPVHNLPLDLRRPARQGFSADIVEACSDRKLMDALQALAQAHDMTLFMVLQSAFAVLLSRWSGEQDIVMAVPVAGRARIEVESLIGCFINTLAFRTDLSDDPSYLTLLERTRRTSVAAFSRSSVPFERVVDAVNPERSQAYNPLCQVKFALQNYHQETLVLDGLAITPINALTDDFSQLHFDLDLSVFESDTGLQLFLGFKRELFLRSSMRVFLDSYLHLLGSLVARPDAAVSKLELTDPCKTHAYLQERRGKQNLEGRDEFVHQVFDRVAALNPTNIAVQMGAVTLSYQELSDKSDRLAAWMQSCGVGQGDWVVLHLERSPALLVAILATLKAGAAYIPIDPANSSARLQAILQGVESKVLLCSDDSLGTLGQSVPVLVIDDSIFDPAWMAEHQHLLIRPKVTIQDSVYAIYTSGSTGIPKGVDISHQALIDYCAYAAQTYYSAKLAGSVLVTSHSFDLAVPSLFLPLLHGQTVKMFAADSEVMEFGNLISRSTNDAYLIRLTPMHLRALLELLPDGQVFDAAHVFVVGGEAMPADLARRLNGVLPNCQIYNHYGPTEATVGCCIFDVTAHLDQIRHSVPIGRPMHNTQLMILDEALEHCADGMPGELYVTGLGVAKGYLNQHEQTLRVFVANPHLEGQLMYRTGDRVRCLPDGNIEFLGRIDSQLKVRGFRVELGEIQTTLQHQAEVKDAFVTTFGAGDQMSIVAYLTANATKIDASVLLDRLRVTLPAYMIPSQLFYIEEFPLNDNGKVDVCRLRMLASNDTVESTVAFRPPQSLLEKQVAQIWADILILDSAKIELESDFYDLGGQSLLAMRLLAAIRSQCNVDVSVVELFESRKLDELCRLIETRRMLRDLRSDHVEELDAEDREITI